jgi:hypothetical protein
MFAHPRRVTVEAFALSALPDFLAIPASIPHPRSVDVAPCDGRPRLLDSSDPQVKSSGMGLVYSQSRSVARCRLRPRGGNRLSSVAILFL